MPNFTFCEGQTSDDEIFLPLFKLGYGSYRNLTPGEPTVATVSWLKNNRDEDLKNAN